jgi:nucleotidyltransferase substrate binding protein (TIGR01987 family)
MNPDIRWTQRFINFERGVALLDEALENVAKLSMLEKERVIQRFESTIELAWKTLKDFLEESGLVISPITPRQLLKDAFAANILPDGQVWIDMVNARNLLSHTYDSTVFEEAVEAIADRYLPALKTLHAYLAARLVE